MNPFNFDVFTPTSGTHTDLGKYTSELKEIGNLSVPTGHIVACDPLVFPERSPFERSVTPGTYPVYLHLAHFGSDHMRVAFGLLRFQDQLPVTWELATMKGQDVSTLQEDEFFGYPVDAGTGCFMDAKSANIMAEMEDGYEFYENVIEPVYDEWANIQLSEEGDNVILFHSGWGDGSYPSFWGLNEQGEAVCLVTNFFVIDGE